jgi:GNAT superfamily N-acetyltransferase
MIPESKTHSLTSDEIEEIIALGFQFQGISTLHEDFINTNFPNFNLLLFSKLINNILSPLCHTAIYKFIHLNNLTPPEIHFEYYTDNYYDEVNGLALLRIFSWQNEKLIVTHDYFRLPESGRGKGIAKQVFRASLQQYVNMGVKKILVHAALKDGGYVWARNFFTATNQNEIRLILNDARKKLTLLQFKAVKRIYTNYYTKNPKGGAFPIVKWAELPFMKDILRGSSWHGLIDFDNQEQFSNFTSYVFQ